MAEETHKVTGQSGQLITLPTLESLGWRKEGYVFRGWGKTRDAKIIETRDGGTVQYDNSTNLYALWASTDYFYFKAQEDNASFKMSDNGGPSIRLDYSIDNKQTWRTWDNITNTITLEHTGDVVYIRARDTNTGFASSKANYKRFVITDKKIAAGGNIMSLLDKNMLQTSVSSYCFSSLFSGCSALVTAPELPATTLASYCYSEMFRNCTNLVMSPTVLPAEDAYESCYEDMFAGCTSLDTVPDIKLKNIQKYCMREMFYNCTGLKNLYVKLDVPSIPSEQTGQVSYIFFNHGAGLSIDVDFTEWTNQNATQSWLMSNQTYNAGTFICPEELKQKFDNSLITRSVSTVPENWTIVAK